MPVTEGLRHLRRFPFVYATSGDPLNLTAKADAANRRHWARRHPFTLRIQFRPRGRIYCWQTLYWLQENHKNDRNRHGGWTPDRVTALREREVAARITLHQTFDEPAKLRTPPSAALVK